MKGEGGRAKTPADEPRAGFGLRDVAVDRDGAPAALTDFSEHGVGAGLIAVVQERHRRALPRGCYGGRSADPARPPGHDDNLVFKQLHDVLPCALLTHRNL